MRIQATRIDPMTGEPDPHGIPQIDCPGRRGEVNPQFTCLRCPCAMELETHQAIDDLGGPYYLVDAVKCTFQADPRSLPAQRQRFPTLVAGGPPRVELGVICPLLSWPDRSAPLWIEMEGKKWVPVGNCSSCQFYRGLEREPGSSAVVGGAHLLCSAPLAPATSPSSERE